jgi:hypothetical protein
LSSTSQAKELTATIIRIVSERRPQNVKQLIILVKEELSLPEEKIIDAVLNLQSQGKIKLDNSSLQASPKQALWYWATIAIAAITVVVVFTVPEDFYPWSYLRNALGIIFVLWLPGYAAIKALFPTRLPIKTSTENLDAIERVALSLGMSLALVPIVGLLLNYTPWGIRLTPIVLSLLALTIVFATAAIIRENKAKKRNFVDQASCSSFSMIVKHVRPKKRRIASLFHNTSAGTFRRLNFHFEHATHQIHINLPMLLQKNKRQQRHRDAPIPANSRIKTLQHTCKLRSFNLNANP